MFSTNKTDSSRKGEKWINLPINRAKKSQKSVPLLKPCREPATPPFLLYPKDPSKDIKLNLIILL